MQPFRFIHPGQGKRHSVFEEPVQRESGTIQPPPSLYGPVQQSDFGGSEVDDLIDNAIRTARGARSRPGHLKT
ncbi:MAG: hypothetical protein ACRDZ5_04925 [Acidimicrobiales bacterium]